MFKLLCKCVLWLSLPFWTLAQATSVVFLNPGNSTETFWVSYSHFMQIAAKNLGMDLRILYAERDAGRTLEQAREVIRGAHKPDYLMLVNEQYIAPQILRLSQGTGIKLFIVNSALTQDQRDLISQSRHKYSDWIGSMLGNDEEAGYLMLKELLRQHGPVADGQSIELLAFSGLKVTPSAQLREQGLRRALAEFPQVHLRQLVYGEWARERAYRQAQQLLRRYPQTRLVWSANDEMALGAMDAARELGLKPGKDLLFSGLNSSPEALQALIDGQLSVLVAGHFTLGGWALVALHDDALGIDPRLLGGPDWRLPLLQPLTRTQAQQLLRLGNQAGTGVDFRALSAQGKPAGYRYPFGLQLLLR
ncbi:MULTISPECIES: ABC transporter substrate-binding protein [unclassified Pseudomonas]|uniref:ABC transporter substrate-binding protein n=1 Tax=unclassified Pseudomonas TaxID=196821 RepID=UPI0008389068|nr:MULTISPECIES: ABC transporter substrate-binding protein [unclassified Pseudomonas]QIH09441.1 substrate-binding domain-containing protein [Pseudomonas sp. BIOMIG1BAC]UMZ09642.1 ABC transporter substrate-binding protein [Pseudomonas sp. MPFS]